MAFDVSGLTAYVDENKFELVAQMQAEGGLAEVVNIQTGIKGSANIQVLDSGVTFGADDCSPVYTDSTTFSQRKITVGSMAVNEKICAKDLIGFYTQAKLKQGKVGEEILPMDIENLWLESKANKIKNLLAKADFQGDTTSANPNLNKYDGLLKLIDADGTTIAGNTSGVASVDVTNVLAVLKAMYMARPDSLREKTDVSLWLPFSIYDMYRSALIDANLYHHDVGTDGEEKLFGTDVVLRPTVGLTGVQRMILASDSNITVGIDGEHDEDEVKVVADEINDLILYKNRWKRGVQYAFGDEIVEFT